MQQCLEFMCGWLSSQSVAHKPNAVPLGKYKDFSACHAAKMREGLSAAAADRYCGALQQQIEGGSSSQEFGSAPNAQMSQAEMMKNKGEEDNAGGEVTFTAKEIEALAQAATDGDMQRVLQIISEKVNIQEESSAPPPAA